MKDVRILTSEEIKNITPDTIKMDAVTATRLDSIRKWKKLIEEEEKAICGAILEKTGHVAFDNGTFKTIISDYFIFDGDAMKEKYGEAAYEECKVKPVHKEQVRV